MKVAKIVSQTKEFDRLQELIVNIETAIENLKKPKEDPKTNTSGTIYISGQYLSIGYDPEKVKTIDVYIKPNVTELISDKLVGLLTGELVELKAQQSELEV